ncbi:MAG: ABC transporter substrate-binding protein [Candidatus Paceibacterota bacterium]|jgi:outer membrane protein OmpA-like peptidoglycan-associated protein/ABC-type taurine transport system substrate-binding protein
MKKYKIKLLAVFVGLLAAFSLSLPAAQYIASPPLTEVVKTKVGPVQEGSVMELPIITWGGDIATIHANGGGVNTAPGSIFAQAGLKFKLVREDVFAKQLEHYISGVTPYLRGTAGMMNQASELTAKDPRTKLVVIYQMTWSSGGDCLVVKSGINTIKDLKGKTVCLQAYSPHVEYLATVLKSAGLQMSDVKIRWVKDLTGTAEAPSEAFKKDPSVDACFVISPDAAALTSNGTVGTGSEGSVKGAKILLRTLASRIIPDVYGVRSDYFEAHKAEVGKFVHALLSAQESLSQLVIGSANRKAEYDKLMTASAKILLDSEQAVADAKGLYGDCEFVGYVGNVKFFATPTEVRKFETLTKEMQDAFLAMGLLTSKVGLSHAGFDYEALKRGLTQTVASETPRFQVSEVAKVIDQRTKQGPLANGSILSLEIYFSPNQNSFNAELYKADYDKAIELAATYGGAILTVEGHADPTQYIDKKLANAPELVLSRLRQSAKNLSLTRAIAVRESLLNYAKSKGVVMDPSQYAVVGHGFEQPKTGIANGEPIRPKTQQEWASNMRVVFNLIPVGDTEMQVFAPAGGAK